MTKYIVNRLLQAIPTVLVVSILAFLMLQFIPGDPAEIYIGDRETTPERLEQVREHMGLNRPIVVRSDSRVYLRTAWWVTTFPGLAIMVTVLAINLLGDGLRIVHDPRLKI